MLNGVGFAGRALMKLGLVNASDSATALDKRISAMESKLQVNTGVNEK